MTLKRKLFVGGGILVLAVGYLAWAGMSKGWVYYVPVDQFAADKQFQTQRVRLMGKVSENGLAVNAGQMTASFNLAGKVSTVPVSYRGAIPDLFKAGGDVVVEGKMAGERFQADVLMTKCASKYEGHGEEKVQ